MTGSIKGFAVLIKQNCIDCPLIHCIIHRKPYVVNLWANLIRGGNKALIHGKFAIFLSEINATYGDLLIHSEIWWPSAEQCLQCFFALQKEIPLFLKNETKSDCAELQNKMQDPQFLADLAFLTDMTLHLNELSLKLQGKQHNIGSEVN